MIGRAVALMDRIVWQVHYWIDPWGATRDC